MHVFRTRHNKAEKRDFKSSFLRKRPKTLTCLTVHAPFFLFRLWKQWTQENLFCRLISLTWKAVSRHSAIMLDGLIKFRAGLFQWVSTLRPSFRAGMGSGLKGGRSRERRLASKNLQK